MSQAALTFGALVAGGGSVTPAGADFDAVQQKMTVAMAPMGLEQRAPHEVASLKAACERIAALSGPGACAEPVAGRSARDSYFIPIETLSAEQARVLGIRDEDDFWGGIVPVPFVGTKLVSHPLWLSASAAPEGWKELPGLRTCTLPGFSTFSREDATAAGRFLLRDGQVRLKCPQARGGHGQAVVGDERALIACLDAWGEDLLARGLVLERDLVRSRTLSVGSSRVLGRSVCYHGEQYVTHDPEGNVVYGGSRLRVHAGELASMAPTLEESLAHIVRAAMDYDRIVTQAYGVIASRRNYDVIEGTDSLGQVRIGVLEQSWRFGGASMAEVLALEWFAGGPGATCVTVETVERHEDVDVPRDAVVHWRGAGGHEGPRIKYARIVEDGCHA